MSKQLTEKEVSIQEHFNEVNESLPILDFMLNAIIFFKEWSEKIRNQKFNNLQFTIECYRDFSDNIKDVEELCIYLHDIELLDAYNSFLDVCTSNHEWLTTIILDTNSELDKAQQFLSLLEKIKKAQSGLYEYQKSVFGAAHLRFFKNEQ